MRNKRFYQGVGWGADMNGFGNQVTRVLLAVTIVDRDGAQVPYSYGASVGAASLASR